MDILKLMGIYISNKATSTKVTYGLIIEEFFERYKDDPLKVQIEDVWEYVFYLRTKPGMKARHEDSTEFSPRTINRNIQALKGFYGFLISIKKTEFNPFSDKAFRIKTKNLTQKRPTESLQFTQVRRFCNTPKGNDSIAVRDRAALTILFATGIRRNELVGLTVGDFRYTSTGTHYLVIRKGKGGKQRFATMPKWSIPAVAALRDRRLSEGANQNGYLFVSYRWGEVSKEPLRGRAVYDMFIEYRAQAGLPKIYTPHSARATAITKLLYDGKTYKEVQQFSGHESIQMVEVYDKRVIGIENAAGKNLSY